MHEVYASKKNECEIACMSACVLSGGEGGNLPALQRELYHQISKAHVTSFLPLSHKHLCYMNRGLAFLFVFQVLLLLFNDVNGVGGGVAHMSAVSLEARRGSKSPGAEVTGGCASPGVGAGI